jgi:asparagine synthetase B (glutamine-hydrolysing)
MSVKMNVDEEWENFLSSGNGNEVSSDDEECYNTLDYVNQYCKNRGPDYTNFTTINDIYFVHNLLHITGEYTIQPFNYDNNYANK